MLLSNLDLLATAPGGVARLRELILTLAVQGKLVPQDPADEPASVLLQRIRAEKDRLIAEGKIKREKLRTEISDDEATHTLPEQWLWVRLGAIATKLTDGSHNPPRDAGSGFPMLSSQNVWEGGVIDFSSPTRYVSADDFAIENARTTASPGDVLLTIVASLGRSAVVPDDAPPFALQRSVAVIRSNILPGYLALFLRSPVARDFYDEHGKGTAQKGIYLGKLGTLPVPVPPLAEQARIVARVEELMRLCDALEAKGRLEATQHAQLVSTLLGTLTDSETPEALADNWQRVAAHFDLLLDRPEAVDALEQTLLQLAVRGLLVPQDPSDEPASVLLQRIRAEKDRLVAEGKIKGDKPLAPITEEEKPFALPRGWAWVRFGEVTHISSGVTLGRRTQISRPLSLPYLRVANVQRWHLNLSSMKEVLIDEAELERFQLRAGDLLITEGGDWDKVGRTAIWRDELPTCLHQNHVFKARGACGDWNANWAELYLNSAAARAYFASSAKQTTNLASINMTELRGCVFPLPPLAEQARIVARVEALRRLCADLRQRLSASQATQAQLAEALVAGAAA